MITFPLLLEIFLRKADGTFESIDLLSLTKPSTYSIGRSSENDICLDDQQVSRRHAFLIAETTGLEIVDRESTFGTFIGNERIRDRAPWTGTRRIRIDPYEIALVGLPQQATSTEGTTVEVDEPPPPPERTFPYTVFNTPVVDVGALGASGYLHGEFEYLALGGGIGSFAWVDHLRIFGVPAKSICVLGSYDWNPDDPRDYAKPYGNLRRLCQHSQIRDHERLRSNSMSTPDNIWGFPGYASRESWRDIKRLRIGGLRHIVKVFGEPALAESYAPRSEDVFQAIDREAARIGWPKLCLDCQILALRTTTDGRYAVAFRMKEAHARGGNRDRVVVGKFVHLATGYPAYRTEKDVFDFNTQYLAENRVFKAYDRHDRVYEWLEQKAQPAAVAVRGRGIVASRILQRLAAARAKNDKIQVFHQMRTAIDDRAGSRYGLARRAVSNNTELQPFDWPKSCWGGELRSELENASPENRSGILASLGGTTTAVRRDWRRIVGEGRRKGWYRVAIGRLDINGLSEKGPAGKVVMEYSGPDSSLPPKIEVDYVIDCIGLIDDLTSSEFLKDLVETYPVPRNRDFKEKDSVALRGIALTPDFEVASLRQDGGRVYAAGQIVAHGSHAAVDTFLGLQYAALRSVDHLYTIGAPNISRFGLLKSFSQWLRWCFNRAP
jgi:pSer/pThr/pTyr-binding forkhead associated (FHA) protein